jgi:hypothetical protein
MRTQGGPGGHEGKQRKKVFFFEKKKQKTFETGALRIALTKNGVLS